MYEENGNGFDSNNPNAILVEATIPENECYNSESSEPKNKNIGAENVDVCMEITTSYSCGVQQDQSTTITSTMMMDLVEDVTNNKNHEIIQFPCYYPKPTPDLVNFLHLSPTTTSSLGNSSSSISFENQQPHHHNSNYNNHVIPYDPFLHLNTLPPPTPLPPLFQSSNGYNTSASKNDFVFGDDDIQGSGIAAYQDFENGVIELSTIHHDGVGKRRRGNSATNNKHFTSTTERQRRVDLGGKFDALKQLIPNPSKSDRASVVGDAIDYIKELLRTVNELKILVEKKRYEKQRMMKRHKVEEGDASNEGDLMNNTTNNHSYNESLRSSWIQRKSKDTEIDVRIIDNEVTIKLVQRKKINCLVYASQVLDELNLDLQHVAGGHIGDFTSFMFNTKINEGSSVYASAIANKLIEVMDRNLAAA